MIIHRNNAITDEYYLHNIVSLIQIQFDTTEIRTATSMMICLVWLCVTFWRDQSFHSIELHQDRLECFDDRYQTMMNQCIRYQTKNKSKLNFNVRILICFHSTRFLYDTDFTRFSRWVQKSHVSWLVRLSENDQST
jgi:hypothetical protein